MESPVEHQASGGGLDAEHKKDSLVQTFPDTCTDTRVDTTGTLSSSSADFCDDSTTSSPIVPGVHTRDNVRTDHMPSGDSPSRSSVRHAGGQGVPLDHVGSSFTLDHAAPDSLPVSTVPPDSATAGSSVVAPSTAVPAPSHPNTQL
jgi:hypothetical protein